MLAMVACIPDWPWYNRSGLQWLPSEQKQEEAALQQASAKLRKVR